MKLTEEQLKEQYADYDPVSPCWRYRERGWVEYAHYSNRQGYVADVRDYDGDGGDYMLKGPDGEIIIQGDCQTNDYGIRLVEEKLQELGLLWKPTA